MSTFYRLCAWFMLVCWLCPPLLHAERKSVIIAQPAGLGFDAEAIGFTSDNKSLFYVFHFANNYSLFRYDLKRKKRTGIFPNKFNFYASILSPKNDLIAIKSYKRLDALDQNKDDDLYLFDLASKKASLVSDPNDDSLCDPPAGCAEHLQLGFSSDGAWFFYYQDLYRSDNGGPIHILYRFNIASKSREIALQNFSANTNGYQQPLRYGDIGDYNLLLSVSPGGRYALLLSSPESLRAFPDPNDLLPANQPKAFGLNGQEVVMPQDRAGVYRFDFLTGELKAVALAPLNDSDWIVAPCISPDGSKIAYMRDPSGNSKYNSLYIYDIANENALLAPGKFSSQPTMSWSQNGAYLVIQDTIANFRADQNYARDVFRYSLASNSLEWVSAPSFGINSGRFDRYGSYSPVSSADGKLVAFQSGSSVLVRNDTTVRDLFIAQFR